MALNIKIKKIFKFLLINLLLWVASLAFAQDSLKVAKPKKVISLKLFPMAYYMPETGVGIGFVAFSIFKFNNLDSSCRSSNLQLYSSYTQNKQFALESEWRLFTNKEKYVHSGFLDFTKFPEFFFGIGNHTKTEYKELYTFDLVKFQSKNLYQIKNKIFIGIQYDLQRLFNIKLTKLSMMPSMKIEGIGGYSTSGIGPIFIYDTRNNILNSSKGTYAEIMTSVNNRFTLSQYNYNTLMLDLRKYFTLKNRFTFAFNAYANFNSGKVPFRAMPLIGGSRYLRGYYRGRYRDNNLMLFQSEIRIGLFKNIGIAVFGGIAQVSSGIKNFKTNDFKYAGGFGLRYKINKKENINLRLDMGYTKEGHGLYIVLAEAF